MVLLQHKLSVKLSQRQILTPGLVQMVSVLALNKLELKDMINAEMEEIERPSFENFLSKPTTLTDHLAWQLGALSLRPEAREAAEQIVGNLNEDGYLIASDEEMLGVAPPAPPEADAEAARNIVSEAAALGLGQDEPQSGETTSEDVAAIDSNGMTGSEAT